MRIPLWVEASRLKVLVFGGGSVGTRRAALFVSAGAKVRILAKSVSDEAKRLGVEVKEVDLWQYDPTSDIDWADIVVIAVSDEKLAERLYSLAESRGKLINDATNAERTHVVVPYERRVSGLRVAVTSEGAAGAPARMALDVIEGCIRASWIPTFFEVYSFAKAAAKRTISDVRKRLAFYDAIVKDDVLMGLVKGGAVEEAKARAEEILKRYI
ncbi:MAG: bifunctional precorrin-2 dehydrogenase/sirohydrochlorin ferrochelatase [Thermoproteus sp. AZ2]|uniref:Bifunctional precorrin-2 dehydrogenase/sirohydrochlorin ferrochelatase n=1 Tax=Thermoproteus sp. AZ2 TaxID=1609232 RepID=A0ACC6V0Y6_9CREN|nr:MAG: siroheme synthase [Thermoproteus sp. AZ2]